jgi:hypothetical protein
VVHNVARGSIGERFVQKRTSEAVAQTTSNRLVQRVPRRATLCTGSRSEQRRGPGLWVAIGPGLQVAVAVVHNVARGSIGERFVRKCTAQVHLWPR